MDVCILTIGLFLGALLPAQMGEPPVPADADPQSDDGWQEEIEEQFQMLTAAYDLDESAQALLSQELQRRLNEQSVYDQTFQVRLADLLARIEAAKPEPGSPEDQAFLAKIQELGNRMPLAPYEVALWTEGQVPEKVAAEGRMRYQELRERKVQRRSVTQLEDPVRQGGLKREFIDARQAGTAPVTPSDKPTPIGPKGARVKTEIEAKADIGQVVEPNQGLAWETPAAQPESEAAAAVPPPQPSKAVKPGKAAKPAETKPQPIIKTPGESKVDARPKPPPGATTPQPPRPQPQPQPQPQPPPGAAAPQPQPPPQKAPPLDEWEKYVIQTSEKYGFTESQITQARGILREMRQRALQYSLSRAADFEHADEIPDAKVRQERLGQLNKPLNALFDELKRRVEALPTTEQRQHAGAAPGGKGQSPTKASPQPGKPAAPPRDQPKGKPVPPPKS